MRPSVNKQNLSGLRLARAVLVGLLIVPLAGCVYRVSIQQGNFLDEEKVAQVAPGMTRSQVRYLLGTPLASSPFGSDRWDYVYYLKRGHSDVVVERKVTVYFENDKVTRVERSSDQERVVQDASARAD